MTNQLIVMGGGVHVPPEGTPYLNEGSVARAERAAEYFYEWFTGFMSKEARIVCAGGYPPLPEGVPVPDLGHREGTLMADYLVHTGVPARVIEVEPHSTSTFTNLAFAMEEGLIDPATAVPKRPLGIVSHPNHVKRAAVCATKLGFNRTALELVPTTEQDNRITETAFRLGYRALFLATKDRGELLRRDRMAERTMDSVRRRLNRY